MSARYALYFAPRDSSELQQFGNTVLGRTPFKPRTLGQSTSFHDRDQWQLLTKQPAHYGFHATLKAPFELCSVCTEHQLLQEVQEFSKQQGAIPLIGLAPRTLAGFLALTVAESSKVLTDFAILCVRHFESFRQPLSTEDMKRRKSQQLTPRQIQLLEQYGYPYVDDEFRFHMTLSGPLPDDAQDFERWVQACFKQTVKKQPKLDQIAVFTQPDRQSAFKQLAAFSLEG